MLLQKLRERAERTGKALPQMYQWRPIRYLITLDASGQQVGPTVDRPEQVKGVTGKGPLHLAPDVPRGTAIRSRLLADNGVYTLRLPDPNGNLDEQDVAKRHAHYVGRVRDCALVTGESSVEAVARFLELLDGCLPDVPQDFDAAATITFRVGDTLPIDLPSVRAYWAKVAVEEKARRASSLLCIVCGQIRPALPQHPIPIRGIPGGKPDKLLISANEDAFMSYGLKHAAVAPTCQECAEAYGNALNDLLRSDNHRVRVDELVYAFWTAEPVGFNFALLLSRPDDEMAVGQVRELMRAYRTGRIGATAVDDTAFYAVGLGPSGKRVVVHDWMDTSLGEAKRRLARYFALQEVVEWDGTPGRFMSLKALVDATTAPKSREETAPPTVARSLTRLAVNGTPLPQDILSLAVQRNRAERGVRRERAALIKMALFADEGGAATMAQLNPDHPAQAYHLGRALALFDAIQYQALGKVNASVVDKFYGTASAAPAVVFPLLHRLAQHHLRTIHAQKKGTHNELALEQVMDKISDPPPVLTLPEQGLFALGFYHQRAANRRAFIEYRRAHGEVDGNESVE
jgi:CRISPR-associated protein Csd1